MPVFLFAALLVALVAVLFALQNVAPVTVAFLTWTFSGSLAVVVILATLAGAVAALLALLPALIRGRVQRSRLQRQVAELESRVQALPSGARVPGPPPVHTRGPVEPPPVDR